MPRLRVSGAELHYDDAGEGRPVVFLHGVWMSSRFFEQVVDEWIQSLGTS
jgi:non-heme chloroperoxidase